MSAKFIVTFTVVSVFIGIINGHNDNLIDQLLKRIEDLEEKGKMQQQQEVRIQQLEKDNAYLKGKLAGEERSARFILDGTEGPVAFHAIVDLHEDESNLGINQTIRFPTVLLNKGNAFHSVHGLFIAPQNGLYLFSTSIMSINEVHANIMKNNTEIAGAYSHDTFNQGSVTVLLELRGGDEITVRLRRPAGTSVYGDRLSSFTGCLLFPF